CYKNGGQNVARVQRVASGQWSDFDELSRVVACCWFNPCLPVSLSPCLLVSLSCGDNRVGGGDLWGRRGDFGVAAGARGYGWGGGRGGGGGAPGGRGAGRGRGGGGAAGGPREPGGGGGRGGGGSG